MKLTVEGDLVTGADQLEAPVRVSITSSRVVSLPVDEAIGDGDGVVTLLAKTIVLAA